MQEASSLPVQLSCPSRSIKSRPFDLAGLTARDQWQLRVVCGSGSVQAYSCSVSLDRIVFCIWSQRCTVLIGRWWHWRHAVLRPHIAVIRFCKAWSSVLLDSMATATSRPLLRCSQRRSATAAMVSSHNPQGMMLTSMDFPSRLVSIFFLNTSAKPTPAQPSKAPVRRSLHVLCDEAGGKRTNRLSSTACRPRQYWYMMSKDAPCPMKATHRPRLHPCSPRKTIPCPCTRYCTVLLYCYCSCDECHHRIRRCLLAGIIT